MIIKNFLKECKYNISNLKKYIYLIKKDSVKLKIDAAHNKVEFTKTNDADIYRIDVFDIVYSQKATNVLKYRFENNIEISMLESISSSLINELTEIINNHYYIIINDEEGNQWLCNPELFTEKKFIYKFTDSTNTECMLSLSFKNFSNYPLLKSTDLLVNNKTLISNVCDYNLSVINDLRLIESDKIIINKDGTITSKDGSEPFKIQFLNDTFNATLQYDNEFMTSSLEFSLNLNENENVYQLIEYQENKYTAIITTSNYNKFIIPNNDIVYEINANDNIENVNNIKLILTNISNNTLSSFISGGDKLTKWISEGEIRCISYDKYEILTKYISNDGGRTWEKTSETKKGELIEKDSDECTLTKYGESVGECDYSKYTITYDKWTDVTNEYICENGDKYQYIRKYVSNDNVNFTPTDEYGKGTLIEEASSDCGKLLVRWVKDTEQTYCEPIDESKNMWVEDISRCDGTTLKKAQKERVTSDGESYYESGEIKYGDTLIENCCQCGYFTFEKRYIGDVCSYDVLTDKIYEDSTHSAIIPIEDNCLYKEYAEFKICDDGVSKVNERIKGSEYYEVKERNNEFCSIPIEDDLAFEFSGDTAMSYKINGTRYTATTSPLSINTKQDLGIKNITSMKYMFHQGAGEDGFEKPNNITKITKIPDTSQVTKMDGMFSWCISLNYINLMDLNTSNVNNMNGMFYECKSLPALNLSNFNTSNVIDMGGMFGWCISLTSLDVSHFDTRNVTNMNGMFYECKSLPALNLSNFDTSNVIDMGGMFDYCQSLTELDVSNFNTSKVTNMESMFFDCSLLPTLNVSNFNTSQVDTMEGMFGGCNLLTSLDASNFDTSNVENMRWMFWDCYSLTSLDVSSFDTSKVTNMELMFRGCSSLLSLNISNFNTSKVTRMNNMFTDCKSLTELDLSNFNTSNVTDMGGMFERCEKLTSLDLSSFDTSNVTSMYGMFSSCKSLPTLNLSNWDLNNVSRYEDMFKGCNNLKTIYMRNCTIDNIQFIKNRLSENNINNVNIIS